MHEEARGRNSETPILEQAKPMDTAQLMILIATWTLMMVWLAFVAVSAAAAFKKSRRTQGAIRLQMSCLWIGSAIVFAGDLLHLIGGTISTYTGNPTGPVHMAGTVFEFRTFSMFFDALVFIIYYTLWILFIVTRYQQGVFRSYDKTSAGLASAAIVLILPGVVPNAMGIYTLQYDIAIWAPHIILFIIFGGMTVYKLISCARTDLAQASTPLIRTQEAALLRTGIGFAFSFLFFFLSLSLMPINELFGMFMIPKTFAYLFAFFHLITGVIAPVPELKDKTH
jgi:hypothetical protein